MSSVVTCRRLWAVLAFVLAMSTTVGVGWAHQTDESEHDAEIDVADGEVEQLLRIPVEDLAHHLGHIGHGQEASGELLDAIQEEIADYIDDQTGVRTDGRDCDLRETEFVAYPGPDGRIHYLQQWSCPVDGPREVEFANRVMLDGHDGYRHTGRFQIGDEIRMTVFDINYPTHTVYPQPVEDRRADDGEQRGRTVDVEETEPADEVSDKETDEEPGAIELIREGFMQIPLGPLHLLFVVALVYAVQKPKSLVVVFGAFVVANSLALIVSAFDWWRVSSRGVELLLPFSVLWVAVKNGWKPEGWPRVWLIAAVFGVVHGFAYSGGLPAGLDLSAPVSQALGPVLWFNLGTELGHLAVVLLVYPLSHWLRSRRPNLYVEFNRWTHLAIGVVAAYWLGSLLL